MAHTQRGVLVLEESNIHARLTRASAELDELRARAAVLNGKLPTLTGQRRQEAKTQYVQLGGEIATKRAEVTKLRAELRTDDGPAARLGVERRRRFEILFFDVAKEHLDEDVFFAWIADAYARVGAGHRPEVDPRDALLTRQQRTLALVGKRSTELQEELDAARKTRDAARASADKAARDLRDAKDRIAVLERELREARQSPERPVVLRAVPTVVAETEPTAAPAPETPRRSRPPGACVVPGCFRGRLMKDGTCGRHGASEAV